MEGAARVYFYLPRIKRWEIPTHAEGLFLSKSQTGADQVILHAKQKLLVLFIIQWDPEPEAAASCICLLQDALAAHSSLEPASQNLPTFWFWHWSCRLPCFEASRKLIWSICKSPWHYENTSALFRDLVKTRMWPAGAACHFSRTHAHLPSPWVTSHRHCSNTIHKRKRKKTLEFCICLLLQKSLFQCKVAKYSLATVLVE